KSGNSNSVKPAFWIYRGFLLGCAVIIDYLIFQLCVEINTFCIVSKTLCAYKLNPNSIKIDILNRDFKIVNYLVYTFLKIND
ncbi:hypothetical protein V8939_18990, partial [Acinetobacter pittii]